LNRSKKGKRIKTHKYTIFYFSSFFSRKKSSSININMYKLFSAISIFLLALSTTTLNVEAQLKGQYPPVDRPPPPVASWTALVDQSKLPKAPIRTIGGPCAPTDEFCVWSCTTCTREIDFAFCPKKGGK
jgi:hypothetical protein